MPERIPPTSNSSIVLRDAGLTCMKVIGLVILTVLILKPIHVPEVAETNDVEFITADCRFHADEGQRPIDRPRTIRICKGILNGTITPTHSALMTIATPILGFNVNEAGARRKVGGEAHFDGAQENRLKDGGIGYRCIFSQYCHSLCQAIGAFVRQRSKCKATMQIHNPQLRVALRDCMQRFPFGDKSTHVMRHRDDVIIRRV